MYEDQTYENILDRSLARVASDVDKREGSVIMNAIAPVSAEHADVYIQLGNIVNNGYADTAVREFLILRCKERGIIPYEATKATLKGKFNMEIPIGSRFNLNELNYVATAFIESADGYFYYQMECETEGTNGNKFFGELSSIEYIDKDLTGELTELLIPAEDEEDTEALRTRYLNSFDSNPFGGNKQDYVEKTDALDGVGGTVVIPVWNGGGTVKLIIINSDFGVASSTLVKAVQEAIDPDPQGTGSGIAPIGHTVTVVEYASMNAQSVIGQGVSTFTDDGSTNMAVVTGATSGLGNGSGIDPNAGVDGKCSVSYRGEENLWGNIWTWLDAINIYNDKASGVYNAFVKPYGECKDDTTADGYKALDFNIATGEGYISGFGYDEDHPDLFLCAEHNGASNLPVGDYYWNNNDGFRVAILGGIWDRGAACGAWCLDLSTASSDRGRRIGGRLLYVPQTKISA